MPEGLDAYRAKRDFDSTPEPAVAPAEGMAGSPCEAPRFVVQEHSARSMHWDLRLEHDGALASWAVPRGIPPDPSRNHLAVRTEDHPLEYLDFHGEIPEGSYGAGTMRIWDRGTYEPHKFRDDEVMITFHGDRLRGRYVLFRTRPATTGATRSSGTACARSRTWRAGGSASPAARATTSRRATRSCASSA